MQPSALFRGVVLLAGLACLPSACGSDSDPSADGGPGDPDAGDPNALDCAGRSGTRIRQVIREHADGSRQVLRLHDADLGETCSFGLAADGSLRCLPVADGSPFAAGTVMYSDPGCTNRIAQLAAAVGETPPTHMQEVVNRGSADGCAAVAYHYDLGNPIAVDPAATLYRKDASDTCVGVTAGDSPYFEIDSELAPEDLVGASESYVGEGRIQQRRLDGDDGSRWCDLGSFRDLELETACQLTWGEDNSLQCLPAPLAVRSYFTENTCADPISLLVVPGTCDTGARYAQENASAACGYRKRVRALGAEYTDPYFEMGGACMQVTPGTGDTAYRLGPAVSGSSFSSFTTTYIGDGGDRLERGDLENGLGLRLRVPESFAVAWQDTTFDTACAFEAIPDQMMRCLPSGSPQAPVASVVSLFSEGTCATAIEVGEANPTCAGGAEPSHARNGVRVYSVTEPYSGPLFRMDGACVEITDKSPYWTLGSEIPPDMFVAGSESTE